MRISFIKKLIDLLESSGVEELEVRSWIWGNIRLSKSNSKHDTHVPALHAHLPVGIERLAGISTETDSTTSEQLRLPGSGEAENGSGPAEAENWHKVTSPMVATFYRAPAPEAPSYVDVGSKVRVGQTLCILEAMKLMNEIEADVSGVIKEILIENGEPVEYGQGLFLIDAD